MSRLRPWRQDRRTVPLARDPATRREQVVALLASVYVAEATKPPPVYAPRVSRPIMLADGSVYDASLGIPEPMRRAEPAGGDVHLWARKRAEAEVGRVVLRAAASPPLAREDLSRLEKLKEALRRASIQRVVQAVVEESEADDRPEGWPDGWPWGEPDPPVIDMPDRSTRWDGPRDAGRRTEQRRANVKVIQHEAGEAALAALFASVPPPPTWPPPAPERQTLVASAYRGARGVRVLPVERVAILGSGRRVAVDFDDRGMPLRRGTTS